MSLTVGLTAEIITGLLVLARVSGFFLIAPIFSSTTLPSQIRVVIILVMTIVMTSTVPVWHVQSVVVLTLVMLFQFAVGFLMGLVMTMWMAVWTMAGDMINYQVGGGITAGVNPALTGSSSMFGSWYGIFGIIVFLSLHGLSLMVLGLHQSFEILPLNMSHLNMASIGFIEQILMYALEMSILMALPLMATGMVTEFGLGIISRAFPQINAFFMAMPISTGAGLLVFFLSIPLVGYTLGPNSLTDFWQYWGRLMSLLVVHHGG